jgi:DMSO/TMAO reductase YedYZ heme-binding membrane subunit
MNLVLFSPRQYENFVYGIQWETFTPGFAVVLAMIVNLSPRSLRWKTICNGALAFFSTYTFANGMLVWVLAFPLATASAPEARIESQTNTGWRLAYILAAIVSIGSYFISYQHPPFSPPPASIPANTPALIHFFLIWIGSVFRTPNPIVTGATVLLLFISVAATAVWFTARDRRQYRSHYPWLVLGAYTLLSGAATARARLGFGFTMAADARYTVFTVMLVIATIGLAFTVYENLGDRRRLKTLCRFTGAVASILLFVLWASTFTAERRILKNFTEYRRHLQLVMQWADAIPENPELAWLSPYPEMRQTVHTLAAHDVLRPRLVSATLARAVNAAPAAENGAAGMLEQAFPDGNGRLRVKGWARVPGQDRPADCVVVGVETGGRWRPCWVVEMRSDRSARGDFSRLLLASDVTGHGVVAKAWAVDLEGDRAYPLACEISVLP